MAPPYVDISNVPVKHLRSKIIKAMMPDKIFLEKGKYRYDWDVHPVHREEKWYLILRETVLSKKIIRHPEWPIGFNEQDLKTVKAILFNDRRGRVGNPPRFRPLGG
jgi:hypothetical protein